MQYGRVHFRHYCNGYNPGKLRENQIDIYLRCLQSLFFAFGWLFFMRQLFKHYEVWEELKIGQNTNLCMLQIRNSVVQTLFSVTFALSCTMFELIIFEIVGIMDLR